MKTFNWKDAYYDYIGRNIETETNPEIPTMFYSPNGIMGGNGTRNNPKNIISDKIRPLSGYSRSKAVLASGYIGNINVDANQYGVNIIIGSGMFQTSVKITDESSSISNGYFKDLDIRECSTSNNSKTLVSCVLSGAITGSLTVRNCIVKYYNYINVGISNSYLGTTIDSTEVLKQNLNLYENCKVSITTANINSFRNNYHAFDNCTFKIGTEETHTLLEGNTEKELRESFEKRCTNQRITLPVIADYGESLKIGRWIFTKGNSSFGKIIKGSEIDLFSKKRNISFGYSSDLVDLIPITQNETTPQSITPYNPKENILVDNDSIMLAPEVDLTTRNVGYVDSKIIWMKGQHVLTNITMSENIPAENGVAIDNTSAFGNPVKSGNIEVDKNYIVRSQDGQPATIMYDGEVYNTSLVQGLNIFRGTQHVKDFEIVEGNPEILEVIDFANHRTIQLRVVDEIPNTKIASGKLQTGYWYFVTPEDLTDLSGSITYKGKERPCFDSFIADGDLSFSVQGKCYLRRCWQQEYDEATETTDKLFWENKQKPNYFDVLPDDMRCLHKNNSAHEKEMQKDAQGNYIASGNPAFYNKYLIDAGIRIPTFDIEGSFMQVRIPISTMNPM